MKPSIPKGTRDFSPLEMAGRNFIFSTIRKVYERFGFQQIETPAMENLSTLEGKYGEEGDRLLFRILDSGDPFQKIKSAHTEHVIADYNFRTSDFSEKGLRYDLTVPFARYVVMHQNEITFPFKRYQIQPVWRADRPQKGRYREFYQCDADVIGSTSLINEVELVQIINDVFSTLDLNVLIKLNNRKILSGIAEIIGQQDQLIKITIALDKIDKIGEANVLKELLDNEIPAEAVEKLKPFLVIKGSNKQKLDFLKNLLKSSETGIKGIEELEYILSITSILLPEFHNIELDFSLARGLNYYTGTIFEVKVNDTRSTFTSSVLGGGRYDDLTGIFGLHNVSGVGISFGVDRIYDVMEECKIFEQLKINASVTKLLFVNFGGEEELHCLNLVKQVRDKGINAEIYPDAVKMKKQMTYADDNKIPFVAIIGSEERAHSLITLKNMLTGEQTKLSFEVLIEILKK